MEKRSSKAFFKKMNRARRKMAISIKSNRNRLFRFMSVNQTLSEKAMEWVITVQWPLAHESRQYRDKRRKPFSSCCKQYHVPGFIATIGLTSGLKVPITPRRFDFQLNSSRRFFGWAKHEKRPNQ
jgi:hypothetical protein